MLPWAKSSPANAAAPSRAHIGTPSPNGRWPNCRQWNASWARPLTNAGSSTLSPTERGVGVDPHPALLVRHVVRLGDRHRRRERGRRREVVGAVGVGVRELDDRHLHPVGELAVEEVGEQPDGEADELGRLHQPRRRRRPGVLQRDAGLVEHGGDGGDLIGAELAEVGEDRAHGGTAVEQRLRGGGDAGDGRIAGGEEAQGRQEIERAGVVERRVEHAELAEATRRRAARRRRRHRRRARRRPDAAGGGRAHAGVGRRGRLDQRCLDGRRRRARVGGERRRGALRPAPVGAGQRRQHQRGEREQSAGRHAGQPIGRCPVRRARPRPAPLSSPVWRPGPARSGRARPCATAPSWASPRRTRPRR